MVLDVPLPGIEPWAEVQREPALWHFHFHQTPRLPEALIKDRERTYIRDFVDRLGANVGLFSDDDVARFAAAYSAPCSLRAGFEFYRAFPENTKWNQSHTAPSTVSIVLVGGSRATASFLSPTAGDLRQKGVQLVTVETIADSGHYVADEQPKQVGALIAKYAGR